MELAEGQEHQLYVNGEWCPGSTGLSAPVHDPATERVIATVALASAEDCERAVDAAAAGFSAWRETDAWTRSRALRTVADLLRERVTEVASVMTAEQGKPLAEARGEVLASADQFDWFADEARRIYGRVIEGHSGSQRLLTFKQPIGPVAAFTAWNFPALLPARKIAAALAAGCSIIVKPALEAPGTALSLAQACHDAGLPAGVVNVLTGDAEAISATLLRSPIIRKVSLTGSVSVGQAVLTACAHKIVPATLELGGHAPVLVFDDADAKGAAELCVRAKFRNCGQVCISPTRFYVEESILDAFTVAACDVVDTLRVGSGSEEDVDVGPLTSRRRLEAVEHLVADARNKGARVLRGGKRVEHRGVGYFYEPTVLTGVDEKMEIMSAEPFGPILPICSFSGLQDGVAKANATSFGLAGYCFTERTRVAFQVAEAMEVGMVGVNNLVIATAEAPFGGIKESGFGREGGSEGIEPYLVTKYVNLKL